MHHLKRVQPSPSWGKLSTSEHFGCGHFQSGSSMSPQLSVLHSLRQKLGIRSLLCAYVVRHGWGAKITEHKKRAIICLCARVKVLGRESTKSFGPFKLLQNYIWFTEHTVDGKLMQLHYQGKHNAPSVPCTLKLCSVPNYKFLWKCSSKHDMSELPTATQNRFLRLLEIYF